MVVLDKDSKDILVQAIKAYQEALFDGFVAPAVGEGVDACIAELKILREKLISGEIVLVEDTDFQPSDDIGYDEQNEIAGNLGSVQKKEEKVCTNGKLDKFAREIRMQNVKREKLKMKKDSYIGNEVIDPAGYLDKESAIKSSYATFWRRLRRMKSRRKSKSIVKVITETTLGDFETQLTKYTNDGYKIKYVNIDTKAGNSGSGVRYYAVVQRG